MIYIVRNTFIRETRNFLPSFRQPRLLAKILVSFLHSLRFRPGPLVVGCLERGHTLGFVLSGLLTDYDVS
jgi:peptidoglycan/LPS O-acetylase OafA/YrhL